MMARSVSKRDHATGRPGAAIGLHLGAYSFLTRSGACRQGSIVAVSHLRLLTSPVPQMTADDACLDAFQRELDYVWRTLRRLGTSPSEVEDLAQELFLALRRSWTEYDPDRPLRPYLFGIAFRIVSAHQR